MTSLHSNHWSVKRSQCCTDQPCLKKVPKGPFTDSSLAKPTWQQIRKYSISVEILWRQMRFTANENKKFCLFFCISFFLSFDRDPKKNFRLSQISDVLIKFQIIFLMNLYFFGSVTRVGNFLHFGQLFKAFCNNEFALISYILRQF